MNLTKKGNRNNHRGVIGIESAIVMIAFVIVAAALSFVVLNMGFSTTQKAKSAITSGLEEVAGSLEISGDVLGVGQVTTGRLNATSVPIAVASDGAVNLDPTSTTVTYLASGIQYNNIYGAGCMLNSTTYSDLSTAMTAAVTKGCINSNPVTGSAAQTNTKAVVYFTTQKNTNSVVESGEVANLVIVYKTTTDRPTSPSTIKAEITPPSGSILTIERNVPSILDKYVDMG